MKHLKSTLIVAAVLTLLLAVAAMAAFAQDENPTYYACVNNSSGTIFIVGAETTCKTNEYRIVWNMQGPPGPPGVSEAWWADRCSTMGCEQPLILTPGSGWHDLWFVDLPAGAYIFDVYLNASTPTIFDTDGTPIGHAPGGVLECAYFSEDAQGNRTDLTGILTPGMGMSVDWSESTGLSHKLELQSEMHFLLSCRFGPGSVDPSLENQAIQIRGSGITAIKVDQIHSP